MGAKIGYGGGQEDETEYRRVRTVTRARAECTASLRLGLITCSCKKPEGHSGKHKSHGVTERPSCVKWELTW
jgi:hypothetical protein